MADAARSRVVVVVLLASAVACGGCHQSRDGAIKPVYDAKTGKLVQLVYDGNRDGRPDSWSYMDGRRIVRIELDTNYDGSLDRWEYYDDAGKLERVGMSRMSDATVDTWMYPNADGSVARVEHSAGRDGRITRREFYSAGQVDRIEEDTDADGRPDKWETYVGAVLRSVAFDTSRQGMADRRLVYKADGSLERIEDVSGREVTESPSPARPPQGRVPDAAR